MRIRGITCPYEKPAVNDELQSLDGKVIGSVTAGAWSPFLETGIAIVQLNCDLDGISEGKLKNNTGIHEVKICDLPFHDKEKNIPTS